MDSVFLRENRGHLSENLSTKNYSFGAKMRIIRRLPPNGSHPLRIPRNTRAQVKLAKSLAWPKEWGPSCVAFGRAFGSHPKGSGVRSSSGPPLNANPNPALCGGQFSFKQKDTPCRKWQGVSSFCLFWGSTLHRKSSTLKWGQPSSPVNPLALAHRSAPSIMVS